MSENDHSQERTEQPSQRRLDKARREGQVARSRELNTMAVTLAGSVSVFLFGGWSLDGVRTILIEGLASADFGALDIDGAMAVLRNGIAHALILLAPVLIAALIATIAAPAALGGFTFSATALQPKFSRLDPLSGLKRIFSSQGLMELVKTLLKFGLLTGTAVLVLYTLLDRVLSLGISPTETAIVNAGGIIREAFVIVASGLILIAAIDVPFVLWSHLKKLRMTRQELRDEHKETEGSPETKARVDRVRREMATRRMMQAVPTADVVIMNPTHYAVALRYTDKPERAPRVVAKGRDAVAVRIRELAEDNSVPVCSAPLLARALYFTTELGDDIPTSLYLAVARVLAWVMGLKTARENAAPAPEFPTDLPVPAELLGDPRIAS